MSTALVRRHVARSTVTLVCCVTMLSTSGCGVLLDAVLKSAGQSVGSAIGNEVGKQVGTATAGYTAQMMHELTPALMQAYAMGLFSLLYYHGGYWFDGLGAEGYNPGQYTRWNAPGATEGEWFEKTFLKQENGQQWWRVHAKGKDKNGNLQEVILEALFDKPDERQGRQILRMRAKMPNKEEAEEIPITEQNRGSWVLRPRAQLTEDSIKGATVGNEKVRVPAGTFKTRHIKYASGNGANHWWVISKGVPGGVVQYEIDRKQRNKQSGQQEMKKVVVQLAEHGVGHKKSVLGAF